MRGASGPNGKLARLDAADAGPDAARGWIVPGAAKGLYAIREKRIYYWAAPDRWMSASFDGQDTRIEVNGGFPFFDHEHIYWKKGATVLRARVN